VSPQWILDSTEQGRKLDEAPYQLTAAPPPKVSESKVILYNVVLTGKISFSYAEEFVSEEVLHKEKEKQEKLEKRLGTLYSI
jgi:hypothetical protein